METTNDVNEFSDSDEDNRSDVSFTLLRLSVWTEEYIYLFVFEFESCKHVSADVNKKLFFFYRRTTAPNLSLPERQGRGQIKWGAARTRLPCCPRAFTWTWRRQPTCWSHSLPPNLLLILTPPGNKRQMPSRTSCLSRSVTHMAICTWCYYFIFSIKYTSGLDLTVFYVHFDGWWTVWLFV